MLIWFFLAAIVLFLAATLGGLMGGEGMMLLLAGVLLLGTLWYLGDLLRQILHKLTVIEQRLSRPPVKEHEPE